MTGESSSGLVTVYTTADIHKVKDLTLSFLFSIITLSHSNHQTPSGGIVFTTVLFRLMNYSFSTAKPFTVTFTLISSLSSLCYH